MNRLNADLILLAAAVIWGLAFLFQKSAMAHVGPLTFIAARSALAALALAPLAWREHAQAGAPMPRGLLPIACGGGLLFFVAAWLQQAGLQTATVTNTGFLTALYVVITPFIAWGWNGKAAERGGVAGGRHVGVRHLAARRRRRSALPRTATCWWRCRRCSGPPTSSSPAAPRTTAAPSGSRRSSSRS